ncbi:MAG: glutamate synthase-related protein [Planctomycetota bacterium]
MLPEIKNAPERFKNQLAKYLVLRNPQCINCGTCAVVCPYQVHQRPAGYKRMSQPVHERCIGFRCLKNDFCCVHHCPRQALKLELNPLWETLGDARWPADLLKATWLQAETGEPTSSGLAYNYQTGQSGGGFDRLQFKNTDSSPVKINDNQVDTSLQLNKRPFGPKITIPIPVYGGGMSFGSIGLATMLARAKAAQAWGTFISTGEGGYPEELAPYDNHIITQVATGLFGVSERSLQRVRFMEFKYAQGAKPGLGGHLLGDKNTPSVAKFREAVPGTSLFSPFPFHSVYSVEDHKKHVDWIKAINPNILVSVKVSTPTDIDMVTVGSYYAGAHIVHLDGAYGGTGAAPEIAKKNIAMPIEYAVPKVHRFLCAEGIRDEITLIASGGIRTALDVAKVIALGADGVVIGTAELVALGCVRCGNCESGRGCPRGIATTDPELEKLIDADWGAQRIINMYRAWLKYWLQLLKKLGLTSFKELRGRMDLLEYGTREMEEEEKIQI